MLVSLTAADFLRYLTWAIFVVIGLWVTVQALVRPTAVNIDIGLLFGSLMAAIVVNLLVRLGLLAASPLVSRLVTTTVAAMPFLLVRLMDDVVGLPAWAMRAATVLFGLQVVGFLLLPTPAPALVRLLLVLSLLLMLLYVVVAGVRAAVRTIGVTRRRLTAATLGSLFLCLNFAAGSLPAFTPIAADDARSLVDIFGVLAGVCYYIGFAPPPWLRRVWQGPELRRFLAGSATLTREQELGALLGELERGAAAAMGARGARIGLWDEGAQRLQFMASDGRVEVEPGSMAPAARAFRSQQPIFSRDSRYEPELSARYNLSTVARAVLAAPMTAGAQPMGVLAVFAPRAPVFAEDDLALLALMANHAALVLESRRLLLEEAQLRGREAAARLKEDFLSTAAHELKTPLTSLVMQAQLLERRAARAPEAPTDLVGLRRLVAETERLRVMVLDLLDAARAEEGPGAGARDTVDLAALAREVAARHQSERHPVLVEAPDQLVGQYDRQLIGRLLENLVENAVKYSPEGGAVAVRLWHDDELAHLTVTDQGIGIPPGDLPQLFTRFHRGSNVDDRRFPGWGLGLSICRRAAEQHGGTITVSSRLGAGSSFHVTLPLATVSQELYAPTYPDH